MKVINTSFYKVGVLVESKFNLFYINSNIMWDKFIEIVGGWVFHFNFLKIDDILFSLYSENNEHFALFFAINRPVIFALMWEKNLSLTHFVINLKKSDSFKHWTIGFGV